MLNGYPKGLSVKLLSHKGMLNQASNVNGTGTQNHDRVIFVSSPSTASKGIEVTSPHFPVYYCYYGTMYDLESSQMLDSTRANTCKAERNVHIS